MDSNVYEKCAEFINKFKEYILGLKLVNGKLVVDLGRKTGFIGLISALSNLLKLYTYLFYILSYKLSKDHIETFFSSIRQRGGFNNNPSCKQFKSAYRKLLVKNEISGLQYGNCIAILDITQMFVMNVGPDSIISNESLQNVNITEQDRDYFKAIHRKTPFLDDVTSYIASFVVKNFFKKIKCDIFHTYLVDNSGHVFILIDKKNRNNALVKPSQDMKLKFVRK